MVLPTILYNFHCVSFVRYSNEKTRTKNTQLKCRSSYFLSGYFYLARGKILFHVKLTYGWLFAKLDLDPVT